MKGIWIILSLVAISGLSACTRCQECTGGGVNETMCETEFDSPEQYQLALDDLESQGATCTASSGF
jgi:hypothetical protein